MLVLRDPQTGSAELEYVRRALGAGELIALPTDTVYGIAALASDQSAVGRLYAVKGRDPAQPTAVVFATSASLGDAFPGLGTRALWAITALLPGPWTLVVRNPQGRLPWLTGGVPGPIGIRIPTDAVDLPPVAATSANPAGRPTASSISEIDPQLSGQLACAIDRGPLATGSESTVLDLVDWETGTGEVRVRRDPAGRAGQALALLAEAP